MENMSTGSGPDGKDVCDSRISVVCGGTRLRADLMDGLHTEGFRVAAFDVMPRGQAQRSDLILLDRASLGVDAFRLKAWRDAHDVPLVVVEGFGDPEDEISCLRSGADDYLARPLVLGTLIERIRARLRQGAGHAAATLISGALKMDAEAHRVSWRGRPVALTHTEFRVLKALAERPGHVKSREQLLDIATSGEECAIDRTIDGHIKRVRKKIRSLDPQFNAIETLYGVGYRYVCHHERRN